MKVSALITAHNYGAFVGEAIAAALSQDYRGELEVVVVDDGSTDDTPTVLARFDGRVRAVSQPNAGQAAALNRAYREATGEVFCLLDADDTWAPGKVREVVRALTARPSVGLVHHDMARVDAAGRPLAGPVLPPEVADGDVSRIMRRKLLSWRFAPTSGLALSRAAADVVFPLDTSLRGWADELIAPVCALVRPVCFLDVKLASYRIHEASLTAPDRDAPAAGEAGDADAARRWVRLVEAKVRQGNAVLSRCGRAPDLSPWTQWSYVRSVSLLEGRPPRVYLPRTLAALARTRGMPPADRLGLLWSLARKACRRLSAGTLPP